MSIETIERSLGEDISKKMKQNNCGEALQVLWELIGSKFFYWNPVENQPNYDRCDLVFYKDPIALPLLKRLISLGIPNENIYVHQIAPISSQEEHEKFLWQFIRLSDSIELLEAPDSDFRIIIEKPTKNFGGFALWIYDIKGENA